MSDAVEATPEATDSGEIDVDALVESIETQGNHERPMSAPDDDGVGQEVPSTDPKAKEPEYEIKWKGKTEKLPFSKIQQFAQKGYDYEQKMAEFNRQRSEVEATKKELGDRYKTYNELDNYVRQNPGWWDQVMKSYTEQSQQRTNTLEGQGQSTHNDPVIAQFKQQIQELSQFKQQFEQKQQAESEAKEDTALDEDIRGIREGYKNVDFDTPDPEGKNLEYKILEHGTKNGFKTFKSAFRDYYHDELMKMAEERGKTAVSKGLENQKKLGIVRKGKPITNGFMPTQNQRNLSYDDLTNQIKQELGI